MAAREVCKQIRTPNARSILAHTPDCEHLTVHTLAGGALAADGDADSDAHDSDNDDVPADAEAVNEERAVQQGTGRRARGGQVTTREFYAHRLNVREICVRCEEDDMCPISHEPMLDPVVTDDGQTYDRANIERWLEQHDTSPATGRTLTSKRLCADGCAHQFRKESSPFKVDDVLTRWGRLYQEYCCMALFKTEQQRLRFLEHNQKAIRAEMYSGLRDAVHAHDQANTGAALQVGQRVILPASFTGGPRDQSRRFQDAMAVVRRLGKPSLFITMTCNPGWPEIVRNLPSGQKAEDRPDLIARVFKLKLSQLLDELLKDGIFGRPIAHLHVIEFQHRGLPHAHILIVLRPEDRFKQPEDVDKCVSAELPPEPEPLSAAASAAERAEHAEKHARWKTLCDLVCTHMVHGPCGTENPGAPCMCDGVCKKKFPHTFVDETSLGDENKIYPTLRRRAPNRVCVYCECNCTSLCTLYPADARLCAPRPSHGAQGGTSVVHNGRVIDNSWIVPYSPYLLLKYQCHINVECCLSVRGVKYLYKYVHKGPDRAMVSVRTQSTEPRPVNEIQQYQDLRSMGSSEGCWRTFNFAMYSRSPPVHALRIHLENGQRTYFVEGTEREALNAGPPTSELMAWFECVRNLPPAERCVQLDDRNRVVWCAAPLCTQPLCMQSLRTQPLCTQPTPYTRMHTRYTPCTQLRARVHTTPCTPDPVQRLTLHPCACTFPATNQGGHLSVVA